MLSHYLTWQGILWTPYRTLLLPYSMNLALDYNLSTIMFKINPELQQKIKEALQADPNADEDTLIDKIAAIPALRIKKEVISKGVREYFKSRVKPQKPTPVIAPETNDSTLDKLKKKVKKSELDIQFQDHPSYRFQYLGGMAETMQEINNALIYPIQNAEVIRKIGIVPCKGFLLAGPIGSGKTLLANCILSFLVNKQNYHAYSVHSSCLLANDAQENIRKLFQAASENQPSIIFLDDIDLICNKDASKRPQGSPISFLTSQMQKVKLESIYFLGTSSNPQKIDVSLKKLDRFEKTINITTNSDFCRQEILEKLLQNVEKEISQEEVIELSKMTSGYMAADLVVLLKEAAIQCILDKQNEESKKIKYEHVKQSLKFVQPVMKKEGFTDIPTTTLDDVGGLRNIKKELERQIIVPMRQQAQFKEINFDIQSGGVLLYGPPGCGKTMMAKAIANAVRANFIIVKGPELLNKYVGESQQAVREVFGRAQRASPCVIFFDEFDALAPKRSDQGNQVTQRVVNTLLTALDGVEERKMVFVIAATNRKDMIDEATLRAGRIQKHIYVPQPDQTERVEILRAISKNMKIESDVDFTKIASSTEGFSGADLKFLVKEATVSAVIQGRKVVAQSDLDDSLGKLLQAKNEEGLASKRREISLQDQKDNEKFEYHYNSQNTDSLQKQKYKEQKGHKNLVMDEFMRFLQSRLSKRQ